MSIFAFSVEVAVRFKHVTYRLGFELNPFLWSYGIARDDVSGLVEFAFGPLSLTIFDLNESMRIAGLGTARDNW